MRVLNTLLVTLVLSATACGGQGPRAVEPQRSAERTARPGEAIGNEQFSGAVRDLLSTEPTSRERQTRLTGVIARQMIRVADRFKARDRELAMASLAGAMALVRSSELTAEMLGSRGYEALRGAAEELAKRGDEGRARAAYEILFRLAPSAEAADIQGHIDAIKAWTRDTSGKVPIQAAGALESAANARLLLEPSIEARDEAIAKTLGFLEKAVELRQARRSRGAHITREEAFEINRALATSATVLVAIHLRSGDAQGALSTLDKHGLSGTPLASPQLVSALRAVVEHPNSDRWLELSRLLRPGAQREGDSEEEDYGRDVALVRVASFVAASEAYRFDKTSPEAAAVVAATLVELGMGEAAPTILLDAISAHEDPRYVSLALSITSRALSDAIDADEADAARWTWRAAEPLLAIAERARGPLQPSPSSLFSMMGEIEIREGRLEDARKLLDKSLERAQSGRVLMKLARLDWHAGRSASALARLRSAAMLDDVKDDIALRAELLLAESDILREEGDLNAARTSLTESLKALAKARASADSDERARVERLLARVLDRFGATKRADKALERALEAAPRDKRQMAATISDIVARALLRGDLAAGREALARGQAADLGREDLVYDAVWVRLLEKQSRAQGDPAADRILLGAAEDPRWLGKIAAFGAGKLKAPELFALAQSPTQKAEALFYDALERKASGDATGAEELLRQVVRSPALDLVEFMLARELLGRAKALVGGPVPDVGLP